MIDYLFVCSQNYLRGPTAEHVARLLGFTADSAGTQKSAVRPLTTAAIERANRIVCMEPEHADAVRVMAPHRASDIQVWNVPDDYGYCQPNLVKLITERLRA